MATFKVLPGEQMSDRFFIGRMSGSLFIRSGSQYVCIVGNRDMTGKDGEFVRAGDEIDPVPIGKKIEITV